MTTLSLSSSLSSSSSYNGRHKTFSYIITFVTASTNYTYKTVHPKIHTDTFCKYHAIHRKQYKIAYCRLRCIYIIYMYTQPSHCCCYTKKMPLYTRNHIINSGLFYWNIQKNHMTSTDFSPIGPIDNATK